EQRSWIVPRAVRQLRRDADQRTLARDGHRRPHFVARLATAAEGPAAGPLRSEHRGGRSTGERVAQLAGSAARPAAEPAATTLHAPRPGDRSALAPARLPGGSGQSSQGLTSRTTGPGAARGDRRAGRRAHAVAGPPRDRG